MPTVETQVHGYRRGHELLASSAELPKDDQSVIDRLSDVAGPLRPNERFEPYLSGYPLPSGTRYVLARTWQDLTVARAGCVRTLSLIIPLPDWADAPALAPFLDQLDPNVFPEEASAVVRALSTTLRPPAPAPGFQGGELLEALFLEEPKPVAVFDASAPEQVAVRIIAAMWAAIRRNFSFSTFARSPRRIEGRYFDLVFAPKEARSKFTDWPGRRVDGRADHGERHRWTGTLVQRVFEDPLPRLLRDDEIALVGRYDADSAAALRIALLWNELLGKIDRTPTAALGLLDIANSRRSWNPATMSAMDPAIASAVRAAFETLTDSEMWDFISAIAKKMQGRTMHEGRRSVSSVATELAARAPEGAVALVDRSVAGDAIADLMTSIGDGLAIGARTHATDLLVGARPETLGRLIAASDALARLVSDTPPLVDRAETVLRQLDPELLARVRNRLLPLLVEDRQLPAARPLIDTLDAGALAEEVRYLASVNDFAAPGFYDAIESRARACGEIRQLRDVLLHQRPSPHRNAFVQTTLRSSPEDASWVLADARLDEDLKKRLLLKLLRAADPEQFVRIVSDEGVRDGVLEIASPEITDILRRMLAGASLPPEVHTGVALRIIPMLDPGEALSLAKETLGGRLRSTPAGAEIDTIVQLLALIGQDLDGGWAAREGLESVPAIVASRNLKAFDAAPTPVRRQFLEAIDEISRILAERYPLDLDADAFGACSRLLLDSAHIAAATALRAAGRLLPGLMMSRWEPVSELVAAAFPMVYRELAKEDDVPDLLKFIPFVDWDRCKSARRQLVSTFMSSSWRPGDLALTACRCFDVAKILRRTAKTYGGDAYIERIAADLSRLPDPCRELIESTLSAIRAD